MANFGIDSNMVFDTNGKSVATRLSDHDISLANTAKQVDLNITNTNVTAKANQSDLDAQKVRLDNIITNSGSSNTENVDGRLGADGVTYPNLGTAIRTQIIQLRDRITYKQNILPIAYTSGGYWNKDVNNNLNLVSNASYNCITAISVKGGTTYTTGIVMGYYSWLKSKSDGTVTKLDNTVGVQETTYTFTPAVDSTLWLSANVARTSNVMVIENDTVLPSTYKAPNVHYNTYLDGHLIDNLDAIPDLILMKNQLPAGNNSKKNLITASSSINIQNATLTNAFYWRFDNPNMTKVSYASYNTLEPIQLKSGITYTLGKVFGRWSWLYDQTTKIANYLDAVDQYLNYTITPTNDSLLYLTCNQVIPQVFTNAYEMPNDTFSYGVPIYNPIDGINKRFIVGAGLQYTSLTQAIADAVQCPHSIVEVKGGTYDLYQEQGGDSYFNTFTYSDASPTFRGIVLKNDVHVIFSSDSKVLFNYTGTNAYVMQYYSPFNVAAGIGGFTLENLNLVASKCRYGIHDERGYTLGRYKNTYKNCKISLDNSQNTAWTNYQCIGGGLGISGYIEIIGCQFTSVITNPTNIVSYHNNGDTAPSKSNVYIDNCWFSDKGYARISYYGTSTDLSEMVVRNCSYTNEPTVSAESSATLVNVKLTKYCNELRV
jgi:hypothetical protein